MLDLSRRSSHVAPIDWPCDNSEGADSRRMVFTFGRSATEGGAVRAPKDLCVDREFCSPLPWRQGQSLANREPLHAGAAFTVVHAPVRRSEALSAAWGSTRRRGAFSRSAWRVAVASRGIASTTRDCVCRPTPIGWTCFFDREWHRWGMGVGGRAPLDRSRCASNCWAPSSPSRWDHCWCGCNPIADNPELDALFDVEHVAEGCG